MHAGVSESIEIAPASRPAMAPPADHMPALTGIRFPLAFWVVAHHVGGPGHMLSPLVGAAPALRAFVEAAWVALTVFFAISGFVLARRYRASVWTRPVLARYAAARLGRIYPVYLLSLLILLPILVSAAADESLGRPHERFGLLVNYVFLLQGWIRPAVNWNTPAWSLSAEVFFYAAAPLILVLARRTSWPSILGTAVVACAVPIALRLTIEPPIPKALLYFGDFLIGVSAAGLYDRFRDDGWNVSRAGRWLVGPSLLGGAALLIWRDQFGSFLVFDTGVRLASAALVLGLACGSGVAARALSSRPALIGGRASYAIYILHIPILWWYPRTPLHAALPPVVSGLVYVALVTLVAVAVSRHYEGPANAAVRHWFERRRADRQWLGVPASRRSNAEAGS
jgi:peptidoglycan/LPS O-acetylase OafA/YrhL